jgi:hypothetical protein
MKKLKKHKLNFDRAKNYIIDNLIGASALSNELINSIDFKNGCFFTLLPDDATIERIYEFAFGGILTQSSLEEYYINGNKANYSITPTIEEELSKSILKEIKNKSYECIFDDVIRTSADKPDNLFNKIGLVYENQVYYLIENTQASFELIMQCLRKSNAIWHSLCILTKTDFKRSKNIKLTMKEINTFCSHASVIIVNAYDGEGYVFWEKNGLHTFEK